MSRIFWDTMLFIFLLEGADERAGRVTSILERSRRRGDALFTSHLVVGEVMAGARKLGNTEYGDKIQAVLLEIGFVSLPFDAGAVERFSYLRGVQKVKTADSINLACAAAVGMDLFLTEDDQLTKLNVPGIQFIAGMDTPAL